MRGASGYGHWATLAAAGANTIRIYQPDSLDMALDSAQAHGLMVVADIPLPKYSEGSPFYTDPDLLDSLDQHVAEVVIRYQGHPALLFWILGNEIGYEPGNKAFYRAIRPARGNSPRPRPTPPGQHLHGPQQPGYRSVERCIGRLPLDQYLWQHR